MDLPLLAEQAQREINNRDNTCRRVTNSTFAWGIGTAIEGLLVTVIGYGILSSVTASGIPDSSGTAAQIGVTGGVILGAAAGLIKGYFDAAISTYKDTHPTATPITKTLFYLGSSALIPIVGGAVLKEPETWALAGTGAIGGAVCGIIEECCRPHSPSD